MDSSWISPAIVAVGVVVNIFVGMRRDAKRQGANEEIQKALLARVTAHGEEIDDLRTKHAVHGERLASLESWRQSQQV